MEKSTVQTTLRNALKWIQARQEPDGFWCGILESNCCMEAQWILGMHVVGRLDLPQLKEAEKAILHEQKEDGAWRVYHDAPMGDINTTVECYAALRAMGHAPDELPLRRAREWILSHGGLQKTRVFTRFWLAVIGEWPWDKVPVVPPEIIRLPRWFPFSIYNFAAWARASIMPLTIVSARRIVKPLPPRARLNELFPNGRDRQDYALAKTIEGFVPHAFVFFDKCLKLYQKLPWQPFRESSIKLMLEWIIRHEDADGFWGGIQPPWIYGIIALVTEGYPLTHPCVDRAIKATELYWTYPRNGGRYLQPSDSAVWDTAWTMLAAVTAGETFETFPELNQALETVLAHQVSTKGDWAQTVKGVECGGWVFQHANEMFPDLDDTAIVALMLKKLRDIAPAPQRPRIDAALSRAEKWLRALQSSNGGWAAYDKDNNKAILTKIPFCDFGEVLDPPSVDVTGHMLEFLAAMGTPKDDAAVQRGVAFILAEQEEDGSWFGRWGVNYIYGTAKALPGLAAAGFDMKDARVRKAADWLRSKQNADGGWGETCGSYMDDALRGVGPSTASQTAWAIIGLLSVGDDANIPAIERGLQWLADTQKDGTWDEPQFTGTGFPGYGLGERIRLKGNAEKLFQGRELARGFMLNYNLYRHYFPMLAMARYLNR